jgi:ubiquitin carboxyl-terminal hydrolase L5
MAMVHDLRIQAREIGDEDMLEREERKRKDWQFENALRRHNFVGFSGAMLKGVVGSKLKEGNGAYEKWVADATQKTKQRMEQRRRGGGEDAEMEG